MSFYIVHLPLFFFNGMSNKILLEQITRTLDHNENKLIPSSEGSIAQEGEFIPIRQNRTYSVSDSTQTN